MSNTSTLGTLLGMPDEDLYELLGDSAITSIGPVSRRVRIQAGKAWFDAHIRQFRSELCGNRAVAVARDEDNGDGATVAAAIADLLASIKGVPATLTVAVLIVRYGLTKLCAEP